MKTNFLYLFLLSSLPVFLYAQTNDDLYFQPKKKNKVEKKNKTENGFHFEVLEHDTLFIPNEPANASLSENEIDAYNRRYSNGTTSYENAYNGNDTLYIPDNTQSVTEYSGLSADEDEYVYSQRLMRFHSPTVGVYISSPYYWDICYTRPGIYWYDPWYTPFAYDWCFYPSWHYYPHYHRPYYWGHWGWNYPHYVGRPVHRPIYRPGTRPTQGIRPSYPRGYARTNERTMRISGENNRIPSRTLRNRVPSSQNRSVNIPTDRSDRSIRENNTSSYRNRENTSNMRQSPVSRPSMRPSSPSMRPSSPSLGGSRTGGGRTGGGRR